MISFCFTACFLSFSWSHWVETSEAFVLVLKGNTALVTERQTRWESSNIFTLETWEKPGNKSCGCASTVFVPTLGLLNICTLLRFKSRPSRWSDTAVTVWDKKWTIFSIKHESPFFFSFLFLRSLLLYSLDDLVLATMAFISVCFREFSFCSYDALLWFLGL